MHGSEPGGPKGTPAWALGLYHSTRHTMCPVGGVGAAEEVVMAAAVSPAVTSHRPPAVWTTIGVLMFLGGTALAGGIALVLGVGAAPPGDWLDRIPVIDSWVVPGLVLGAGFGLGSLLAAYGMLRRSHWTWSRPIERVTRHHWSWIATMLLGLGHVAWIIVELVYLPQVSALQAVYGTVGVALLLLPLHPAVRGYLAIDAGSRR